MEEDKVEEKTPSEPAGGGDNKCDDNRACLERESGGVAPPAGDSAEVNLSEENKPDEKETSLKSSEVNEEEEEYNVPLNEEEEDARKPGKSPGKEDFVIFRCLSYLGAALIKQPRSEPEVQKIMAFLNDQTSDKVITVDVSVDIQSDGYVRVYEEVDQVEISRFKINQIIFFAQGANGTSSSACFAFTSLHGDSYEQAIFQCHTFRCDVPEAVDRVFNSFARAFESPKISTLPVEVPAKESTPDSSPGGSSPLEVFSFQVSLEVKEEQGKGIFRAVPRDKGFFKLRSLAAKQIWLTICQLQDSSTDLNVERCIGLLLSPGRHVRHSDMQLVEMISWSLGSTSYGRLSYAVGGVWDVNDPAFESLNQETAKDSQVFFTVAVYLVIKGIQEPIRFCLETKARVHSATEWFWTLGRKHSFTQQFQFTLRKTEGSKNVYQVVPTEPLGEEIAIADFIRQYDEKLNKLHKEKFRSRIESVIVLMVNDLCEIVNSSSCATVGEFERMCLEKEQLYKMYFKEHEAENIPCLVVNELSPQFTTLLAEALLLLKKKHLLTLVRKIPIFPADVCLDLAISASHTDVQNDYIRLSYNVDVKQIVFPKLQVDIVRIMNNSIINKTIILVIKSLNMFDNIEIDHALTHRYEHEQDRIIYLCQIIQNRDSGDIKTCLEAFVNLRTLPAYGIRFRESFEKAYPGCTILEQNVS